MNRWLVLSLAAVAGVSGYVSPHSPVANPPVELQPTTPGIQQAGNANISGKLLAGTVSATSPAINAQVFFGEASAATGSTYGGLFRNASSTGRAVRGYAMSATGSGTGGDFQTDSPGGAGVKGIATATTGGSYGGYFSSASGGGYGIYAQNTGVGSAKAGYFVTTGASGTAVRGESTNTTGLGYGGTFVTASDTGRGVSGIASSLTGTSYAGYFTSKSNSSRTLYSYAMGTSGTNYGGYFLTASPDGYGVFALSKGNTAVYGRDSGGNTTGVGGQFETNSTGGYGVYGIATHTTSDNCGVYGETQSPSHGFGLFSHGRTGASGTKSFRIDHPLDPENKFLYHYSAEGPEPLNLYSGTVVTDVKGFAWVQLPDYFGEINKNPRYQLTVVDESEDFVMAKVSKRLSNNRFQIRTNKPKVEVCWRVEASRNDRFVQAYGAPEVAVKPETSKGRYQDPELYGKPKELGIFYRPGSEPKEDGAARK